MLPRPRRTARPVSGLRFPVEALGSPEMAPAELPVLFAPLKRPPTAAQQRRMVAVLRRLCLDRQSPLSGQRAQSFALAWKNRPCF